MSTALIEYDLRKPGRNYDPLYKEIKTFDRWAHHLESAWFVTTSLSAEQVRDKLKVHIDANDKLMVVNVTNDSAAWIGLPDDVSKWIKDNL